MILNRQYKWLSEKPNHITGIRVLQICIGLMICARIATEIPFANYLWGSTGIGYGTTQNILGSFVGSIVDLLYNSIEIIT